MPTPDVQLLRRTLKTIEDDPASWDQKDWRCETGMCFAGHAATLAGAKWADPDPKSLHRAYVVAEPEDEGATLITVNGTKVKAVGADTRARRVLGLSYDQAHNLFHADNRLDDLRDQVAKLIAPHI